MAKSSGPERPRLRQIWSNSAALPWIRKLVREEIGERSRERVRRVVESSEVEAS